MTVLGDKLPDGENRYLAAHGQIAAAGQLGSPPLSGRYLKDKRVTTRVSAPLRDSQLVESLRPTEPSAEMSRPVCQCNGPEPVS
jgi:hypothetical protein